MFITQQHMFLSLVWLVSQHEGILLYLIIKSIKATSMLEIRQQLALVTRWGVHGVLIFIVITSVQSADE